jgi:hypothetical protein
LLYALADAGAGDLPRYIRAALREPGGGAGAALELIGDEPSYVPWVVRLLRRAEREGHHFHLRDRCAAYLERSGRGPRPVTDDPGAAAGPPPEGVNPAPRGGLKAATGIVARGNTSQPLELIMAGSVSKGGSHDRLCTLYGRAYAALDQLEAEVEALLEAGAMDGPTADLAATEWAARFDELGGMAGDLAVRIDEACDRPGRAVPHKAPGDWRERLLRAPQSSNRGPGRTDPDDARCGSHTFHRGRTTDGPNRGPYHGTRHGPPCHHGLRSCGAGRRARLPPGLPDAAARLALDEGQTAVRKRRPAEAVGRRRRAAGQGLPRRPSPLPAPRRRGAARRPAAGRPRRPGPAPRGVTPGGGRSRPGSWPPSRSSRSPSRR